MAGSSGVAQYRSSASPGDMFPDWLQKSSVVEPVESFQCGKSHPFEGPPWPAPMYDLGLVKTVDLFGEDVVATIADTSGRRLYAELLGVANGHVLNAPVRAMHEAAAMSGTPIMKSLLQSIEDKTGIAVQLARHLVMRRAKSSITKATHSASRTVWDGQAPC